MYVILLMYSCNICSNIVPNQSIRVHRIHLDHKHNWLFLDYGEIPLGTGKIKDVLFLLRA